MIDLKDGTNPDVILDPIDHDPSNPKVGNMIFQFSYHLDHSYHWSKCPNKHIFFIRTSKIGP